MKAMFTKLAAFCLAMVIGIGSAHAQHRLGGDDQYVSSAQQKVESYQKEAAKLALDKDYVQALQVLSKAVELDPTNKKTVLLGAAIQSQAGNHEKARDLAIIALKLDKQYADAWRILGIAAMDLKDYDLADKAFGQAIKLEPKNKSNYLLGAELMDKMNKPEEAKVLRNFANTLS